MIALGLTFSACHGEDGVLVVLRDDAGMGAAAGAAGRAPVDPGDDFYVPSEGARWLARLDGAVDVDVDVDFFYLDPQQHDPADLEELQRRGRPYLCYLSAGSLEDFRDDAGRFPDTAIGNPLEAFPNERWLDVRNDAVRGLMAARIERLAALGCDGVPPSSLAVHVADTGFSLTLQDALDYSRWIAERLHAAGMSAGLIGPASLTAELSMSFDFGLAIGCVGDTQCREYEVLRAAHRPVLHVELGTPVDAPQLCSAAKSLGFDALVTDAGFGGTCVWCRDIL